MQCVYVRSISTRFVPRETCTCVVWCCFPVSVIRHSSSSLFPLAAEAAENNQRLMEQNLEDFQLKGARLTSVELIQMLVIPCCGAPRIVCAIGPRFQSSFSTSSRILYILYIGFAGGCVIQPSPRSVLGIQQIRAPDVASLVLSMPQARATSFN